MHTISIISNSGFEEIKLPKELQLHDEKAYIKKVGNALYIIPYHSAWQSMKESLDKFTPDFMNESTQQPQQDRELFD